MYVYIYNLITQELVIWVEKKKRRRDSILFHLLKMVYILRNFADNDLIKLDSTFV